MRWSATCTAHEIFLVTSFPHVLSFSPVPTKFVLDLTSNPIPGSLNGENRQQVEQLKSHLRSMEGEDVDRQHQTLRRPRLQSQRAVERSSVGGASAAAATVVGASGSALSVRRRTASVPLAMPSVAHRSIAPLPLPEMSRSVSYRSTGGSSSGGGSGEGGNWGSSSGAVARGKTESERLRWPSDTHRGGERDPNLSGWRGIGRNAAIKGGSNSKSVDTVQPSPSPPRKHDRRVPPDSQHSNVNGVAPITTSSLSPSPVKKLRNSRLRSPESTFEAVAGTRAGDSGRRGMAGGAPMSSTRAKAGQERGEGRVGKTYTMATSHNDFEEKTDFGEATRELLLPDYINQTK